MKYFIAGGCGFLGSNLVHRLLKDYPDCQIVVYDNLSNGKLEFLTDVFGDNRLKIYCADIYDTDVMIDAMEGSDVIYHFASNADISQAVINPSIDFRQGTFLTQNILEAARICGVKKIIYASGSGVYGDLGELEAYENYGPLIPTSCYAASKLGGEALVSAYCHMFDMMGVSYRFANLTGFHQTHGVVLSFIEKLKKNPNQLEILGNGKQSKSYLHVSDVIDGIFASAFKSNKLYDVFNVATQDYITVTEIADLVVKGMGLRNVQYNYTSNEAKGWKGDLGIVRFNTNKIRYYGWKNKYTSKQAIEKSIQEILENIN